MKTILYNIFIYSVVALLFASCKSKSDKPTEEIIVPKPKQEVKHGTQSMQETNSTRDVEWLGAKYQVIISRKPDNTLPLTKDEYDQDYYDNIISVRIVRADGSEAFNRVFHKTDFLQYITDANVKQNGALLGVVFDKVDDGKLLFAASVGSPNDKSDEYVPLIVRIDRLGAISITLDTSLDTDMPNNSESIGEEDYGV